MSKYILSEPAQADLAGIVDRISQDSVRTARKVLAEFAATFRNTAEHPGIGHTREELRDDSARVVSVYNWLVTYDPDAKPLQILRIVHGARDLGRIDQE